MILSNFFYSSILFNKFINKFVKNGQKEKIELIFLKFIFKLSKDKLLHTSFLFYFFEIIEKQFPLVWTRIYFKKGSKTHIPFFPKKEHRYKISCQLVAKSVVYSRSQKFEDKLKNTLFSYFDRYTFYNLKGICIKEEEYNNSVSNRNLKHFRWKGKIK
jgi:Ribosomal protein S7p/S5e.